MVAPPEAVARASAAETFNSNEAKEVVDGVVQNVAHITEKQVALQRAYRAKDALEAEKARVQKLINGLAARVFDQSVNTNPTSSATKNDHSQPPSNAVEAAAATPARAQPVGVRLDDHRVFYIRSSPVSWTQSSDSVTVYISVPSWVRAEHVVVKMETGALLVHVAFSPQSSSSVQLEQPLFGGIDPESSMWMLEGAGTNRHITLEFEKARIRWWSRLFMDDDPANYIPVEDKSKALAMATTPGSPLSLEAESPPPSSPPPPPPPSSSSAEHRYENEPVPPPPSHPPPHDALPPAAADVAPPQELRNEQVVQQVVTNVVDKVAENTMKRADRIVDLTQSDASQELQSSSGTVRRPQARQVTVDDVKKMLEKNIREVESNGPNAASAALQVGMVYWHGPYGIERDQVLAAKYLKFGLENGAHDSNAAFQLGMIYNNGMSGWEANAEEAVRWWTYASRLGHPVSMYNLAVLKMNGNGCDIDVLGALKLFAAANQANPKLKVPALSQQMINERLVTMERLRKERAKKNMSIEEKEERRVAAMRDLKLVVYGTGTLAAVTAGLFAFRHWWNNTL